jgi:hypothetical protein
MTKAFTLETNSQAYRRAFAEGRYQDAIEIAKRPGPWDGGRTVRLTLDGRDDFQKDFDEDREGDFR